MGTSRRDVLARVDRATRAMRIMRTIPPMSRRPHQEKFQIELHRTRCLESACFALMVD